MEGAELYGKVLRCNIAKPVAERAAGKAVWSAEEWIKNQMNEDGDGGVDDEEAPASLVSSN